MQNKTAKTQKKNTKTSAENKKSAKNSKTASKISKPQNDKRKMPEQKQSSVGQNSKTRNVKQSRSSRAKKENPEILARSAARSVRITFLGGINEIGKNLTVFEYNGEMIILDCGMTFPDADMPGIDYVLPDFGFIERNSDKIKAVFITHGHEDHIGGLPYLLKIVNAPVYASQLTVGLIEGKLKEHRMLSSAKLKTIKPGAVTEAGPFTVEAIHVNHSIPDSMGFAIKSPAGVIVHTGDFKIDNTPIDGGVIDLARFASLGNEGVLCLMQDSTNAEKAGYTPSEKEVGKTLEQLFSKAGKKRIIVASFASNIHRIQQIVDASVKMKRKIFLSGRSLENVTAVSRELGFLNVPDGILVSIENLKNYRDEDIVLITTGSQGEPMSALTRMATGEHKKVTIGGNDFVIISATPIPGNEKTVANTINELMKLGAEVIYEKSLGIHVSGHAAQEELKLIMNLVKPKFFIPVHGEQKHMRRHAELAKSVGISPKNILVPELGEVVEVGENGIRVAAHVPAGRIFVDGSGVGDVGSAVLRDRKKLSTDGVVLVTAVSDAYTGGLMLPVEIQTKGFVFTDNANELSSYISDVCEDVFDRYRRGVDMDVNALKQRLKDSVAKVIFDRTKRTPVIIVSVFAV
ncbi:MAG: ribonuclease J [Oscillospiraceae bacterium]|nr:ribonuclease J [Oscillospiraceae bacterium]